jgi:hypothetical protein
MFSTRYVDMTKPIWFLALKSTLFQKRSLKMQIKSLSPEFDELRKVIIGSSLTSCYLLLNEIALKEGEAAHYEEFRASWIDTYKDVYNLVSKLKIRNSSRL